MGNYFGKIIKKIIKLHALRTAQEIAKMDYDLVHQLRKEAMQESLIYVKEHMKNSLRIPSYDRERLFEYSLSKIKKDGSILEFGVYAGSSITIIANRVNGRICHGFDSFEGLPEDWAGADLPKKFFNLKGKLPTVPKNVVLHKGWFNDTIPKFLKENDEMISLMHIDCDLYSSTKTVFNLLEKRISNGTIIVFDEYLNYPNWQQHEFKAFQEFVEKNNVKYEYLAFGPEVCVKINDIKF